MDRRKGFLVAFGCPKDALAEIDRFFTKQHTTILPIAVNCILDEQLARKPA